MGQFADYPKIVKNKTKSIDQEWMMVSGFCAKLGVESDQRIENEVVRIDPTTIICQLQSHEDEIGEVDSNDVPVYRLGENGPLGVPTGQIFIRFRSGATLKDHSETLKKLGFTIEKESPAAACGWVRLQSGSCKEALTLSARLHDVDELKIVEPQFLIPQISKSTRGRSP